MDATTSSPAVNAPDTTLPQQAEQPPQKKPQKELLCTICNLRACWEAPTPPAEAPSITP